MERSSREFSIGWSISIFFHIAVAILLFFSTIKQYVNEPQWVEMSWGEISSINLPKVNIPPTENSQKESGEEQKQSDNAVALPTRRTLDFPDDVIPVKSKRKSITAESPSVATSGKTAASEERRSSLSTGAGSKDNVIGKSTSESNSQVATPFGAGNEAGGIGSNVSFAIQWTGGGDRKLLIGDVPTYPQGVNVSAQIKLRVIVQPDGSIRSAQPAQKGETRLENAAINKVRLWKFEPLTSSQPQVEQLCNITFNFKLK